MASAEVAVVVPARDAAATLPATLAALAAQTVTCEVVVVDNGSRDATAAVAEAAGVRVVRRARGEGPGAARNDGVAATRAPVIAFTDADCVPEPGWLAAGLAALEGADLVQGRVEAAGPLGPFDRSVSVPREYGLYETANLLVRREWLERDGFTDFVPAGERPFGEDAWWAWRARRAGARTAFAPDALVRHAVIAGDARSHVAARSHLRWFPELVDRVPELRDAFLWRGVFLSPRTAAFDLAAAGVVAAVAARRPALLAAALPYARMAARGRGGRVLVADVAADTVGAAALVWGSIRARSTVL
jgi:glycosyltransferase involved in cell wall biosynthesis